MWSCAPGGRSRPHDTNPTLPTLSVPTGRSPAIPQLAESRVEIVVGERRKTVDADSVLLAAVLRLTIRTFAFHVRNEEVTLADIAHERHAVAARVRDPVDVHDDHGHAPRGVR